MKIRIPGPNAKNRINCSFKRTLVNAICSQPLCFHSFAPLILLHPSIWYLSDSLGTMHRFNLGFIQRYGTKNQDRTRIFVFRTFDNCERSLARRSFVGWLEHCFVDSYVEFSVKRFTEQLVIEKNESRLNVDRD